MTSRHFRISSGCFINFKCIRKDLWNNLIHIYDLLDYSLIQVLNGHTMAVFSVQYSPSGHYLVSGSRLPEKPVMLSFDDTDLDQFTTGYPEMKK